MNSTHALVIFHVMFQSLQIYLFEDLSSGGMLCHIMATAYRVKTEQLWLVFAVLYARVEGGTIGQLEHSLETNYCCFFRSPRRRFDFLIPSRMDRGLDLFMAIHKDLASSHMWEPPRVYLSPSLSDASRYIEICKRHQGVMVSKEEESTHVIVPARPVLNYKESMCYSSNLHQSCTLINP